MNSPSDATNYQLPDGIVAVVKRDCPTCVLVGPVLAALDASDVNLTVISQDDPSFPEGVGTITDDRELGLSWHNEIETVPTLVRVVDGVETERIVGWSRQQWLDFTGVEGLGADLPEMRPGCGSLSVDPNLTDELTVRFSGSILKSRRIEFAVLEDEMEAAFDRGWSDGLPVVPPTEARVLRMLAGTDRAPDDVVAIVPPDLNEVTVEQVAVNAVLAGCKPEYLPVVLAAVEAACTEEFNMHGLLATTYFSGPIVIVNGPIAKRIGMNSGGNLLGQGNRANLTIGRALQLVIRNLGGGRPGGVDMAMHGSPGKLSFCFAENDELGFGSLAGERGGPESDDALTLFAGQGPTPIVDQISRTPESLARTFASILRAAHHPKLGIGMDAMLVISPEHSRVFSDNGWDRARIRQELEELLIIPGSEMVRGVGGIEEGLPEAFADSPIPKFRAGGLLITFAGGPAGLFSSVLTGWVGGGMGSEAVTIPIR